MDSTLEEDTYSSVDTSLILLCLGENAHHHCSFGLMFPHLLLIYHEQSTLHHFYNSITYEGKGGSETKDTTLRLDHVGQRIDEERRPIRGI